MTDVILLAHGKLATAMKASGEMIFGELPDFHPIEFLVGEGLDTVVEKLEETVATINADSVLILTDIFSGTPYNASCAYAMKHSDKEIRILSGMSLPIVLEIATMRENANADAIVAHILDVGKDTIRTFELSAIEQEEEL
ncbi:MAG: PTS sugar transporter subunit IIA [Absicoccus sp.]|uniref:PTS sugar transporter subunit IIA n=1 Tax=Absicoccus sp. TaxID=2718527 RepID=UPI002A74E8C2|nr:PTS sugar transporter subunit IIA [Absicoccus sp.]MDY3036243.1 PTS sugar transporter subunit IIA [Absicoccus sp.]